MALVVWSWFPITRKVPAMLRQVIRQQSLALVRATEEQMTLAWSKQYQNFLMAVLENSLHFSTSCSLVSDFLISAFKFLLRSLDRTFPLTATLPLSSQSIRYSPLPKAYLICRPRRLTGLQLAPLSFSQPLPKRTRVLTSISLDWFFQVVMARKVPTMLRQIARNWQVSPRSTWALQMSTALVRQYQYFSLRRLSTNGQTFQVSRLPGLGSTCLVLRGASAGAAALPVAAMLSARAELKSRRARTTRQVFIKIIWQQIQTRQLIRICGALHHLPPPQPHPTSLQHPTPSPDSPPHPPSPSSQPSLNKFLRNFQNIRHLNVYNTWCPL